MIKTEEGIARLEREVFAHRKERERLRLQYDGDDLSKGDIALVTQQVCEHAYQARIKSATVARYKAKNKAKKMGLTV